MPPGTAGAPRLAATDGISVVAPPAGEASRDLLAAAHRTPGRRVEAIVQLQPGASAAATRSRIAAAHGRVLRSVALINGLAVRMPARAAVRLAATPGVKAVSLNARVVSQGAPDASKLSSAFNSSIRADAAWGLGATGKGVGVAVIDTGLAGDLPDFRVSDTDARSRGVASAVVNPFTADAKDSYGHGTHVAGLIAGNGANRPAGDPLKGRYSGVAPEANLVAVKADDGRGHADVLSLIDGLQFVVSHKAQYGIRVVNLSVRTDAANSYKTDPLDAAVEATWMHGIVVVAAAGNGGDAPDAVAHAPGNDPYVITVGAVDDKGTKDISDDRVASWSSRGTTQDGVAKPDVLAPGAHIVAPLAPGSYYASACRACVVDGQYLRIGGTSMAAAVVSGAVADILQAFPSWTPDQVKATLLKRSRGVTDATGLVSGSEVALDKVLRGSDGRPEAPANQDLVPNDLVDPATGTLKVSDGDWAGSSWGGSSWGGSSWGGSSWGAAPAAWNAAWAPGDSFVPAGLTPATFDVSTPEDCWILARTGFSGSSWGGSSWGSDELHAAADACNAAAKTLGSSWGGSSWGGSSWGGSSWGGSSWGGSSWGGSSWGGSSWGGSSWGGSSWGGSSWGSIGFSTGWDK